MNLMHDDVFSSQDGDSLLGMGSEGLVRFLKAKLKGLQTEMQALQSDYKKQVSIPTSLHLTY